MNTSSCTADDDALNKNFRRYTKLKYALEILRERRIVLRDPSNWEDKNDSKGMEIYKKFNEIKTLRALCFADTSEGFHHWSTFSREQDGVAMIFDREKFIASIPKDKGFRHEKVKYYELEGLDELKHPIDIPFSKRYPYYAEGEYRVIYESGKTDCKDGYFEIDPQEVLIGIILSPWLSYDFMVDACTRQIKNEPNCSHIKVHKSTLIENNKWLTYLESIAKKSNK